MRIIFFGTGKFGIATLEKLVESDHEVAAVVSQPDRKKGRGWEVLPGPVKEFIQKASPDITIFQPEKASDPGFIDSLNKLNADIFIVIDYGQILKKELLDIPDKYCINLHPSLLPEYRGAAPVNRVILNGETETGSTVFKMSERMDAGDIILQEKTKIKEDENAVDLLERLSIDGACLIMKVLEEIERGRENPVKQDEERVSYAPKLEKAEGKIDWAKSADEIARKIRAMQPWPGAYTSLSGKTLKIIEASILKDGGKGIKPGTVYDNSNFVVSTADGSIHIKKLQLEGKKEMPSDEFLRGHKVTSDTVLGK